MDTRYWFVKVSEGETRSKKVTGYFADTKGFEVSLLTDAEKRAVSERLDGGGLVLDDGGDPVTLATLRVISENLFIGEWVRVEVSRATGRVAGLLDRAEVSHSGIDFHRITTGEQTKIER